MTLAQEIRMARLILCARQWSVLAVALLIQSGFALGCSDDNPRPPRAGSEAGAGGDDGAEPPIGPGPGLIGSGTTPGDASGGNFAAGGSPVGQGGVSSGGTSVFSTGGTLGAGDSTGAGGSGASLQSGGSLSDLGSGFGGSLLTGSGGTFAGFTG